MSNAVTILEENELSPWKAFADESAASAIVGELLRFTKGRFICGEEKRTVPVGTAFVVNMAELYTGWQRWWNGSIAEHRISRVIDRAPRILRDDLGHLDENVWEVGPDGQPKDPWSQVQRLVMREAESKRRLVTFTTSSWGGRVALGKLCQDYDAERSDHPGACPVVQLGVFMQRHKQYGEIPQPRFDIIGWQMWDGGEAPRIKPTADDPRTLIGRKIDDEIPGEWL